MNLVGVPEYVENMFYTHCGWLQEHFYPKHDCASFQVYDFGEMLHHSVLKNMEPFKIWVPKWTSFSYNIKSISCPDVFMSCYHTKGLSFLELPVKIELAEFPNKFFLMYMCRYYEAGKYHSISCSLIAHKSDLAEISTYLSKVYLENRTDKAHKTLNIYSGEERVQSSFRIQETESVIVSEHVKKLVIDDIVNFLRPEIKEKVEAKGLPYKRGYIFYGPPGNGKTTVTRLICSLPQIINCYTIDFGNVKTNNATLKSMFESAAIHSPSVIILEDIDRMFAKEASEEFRRNVTLQELLNCLDGITCNSGVIVVATANHPTNLDPAILKRPGRFDKVVEFKNPAINERVEYITRYFDLTDDCDITTLANATDQFSFAQLKEILISSMTLDYENDPTIETLLSIVEDIKCLYHDLRSKKGSGAGFN